jgi:hypothetical protein
MFVLILEVAFKYIIDLLLRTITRHLKIFFFPQVLIAVEELGFYKLQPKLGLP